MKTTSLTLRINRRAIGAVVLDDESLTVTDGRHLTSKPGKTVPAATRFVEHLLTFIKPSLLVVEAPRSQNDSTTHRIADAVAEIAAGHGLELLTVGKTEVLSSYGIKGARNRRELRDIVRHFWPELANVRGQVEPFVVDAAATALYADCRLSLERVPR